MVPELWPSVIRSELVRPEFTRKNGVIELPHTPGLGVELNEELVRRLSTTAAVGGEVARNDKPERHHQRGIFKPTSLVRRRCVKLRAFWGSEDEPARTGPARRLAALPSFVGRRGQYIIAI